MTHLFQTFTETYANILRILTGLAVVSSILLYPGCGMTSSRPSVPNNPTDTSAPTSAITAPAMSAIVTVRATTTITGTASDTGGGSVARVEVSVDGGATFSAATGTTSWSFNWTPTTPGQATIRSRAVDTSGNTQNPPAQITVTVARDVWTAQGPGPIQNGQVDNVDPDEEVVGAIHAVAAHPTDANILYIGGVNSGIWRTGNAKATRPNWTPLTDNFQSLSIGALEFDPTDATHRTLIAGIGRFSSFGRSGGPLTGILRTTDGGDNWTQIPLARNISGIAARGATLLVSANQFFSNVTGGVFRSANGGATWVTVSGSNGLPAGGAFDLVGDPKNLDRFYVSVQGAGIFRSDNGGANWTNISSGDPTLNGVITQTQDTTGNAEMAVAGNERLYVIVVVSGQAQYIGYTDNPAASAPTWTAMDLPQTVTEGLHPGEQGSIHLSIAVDHNSPNSNPNIVYVAGDRQDDPFPNFIGANNFSGRLFRGDTTAPRGTPPSPQWKHLTHSNSIPQIPGGGTANGSAPHADSRDMVIDAGGELIEVDDGGIYRRTSPLTNAGDWFSINGDLQATEFHDVAYDTNSNTIILAGAQDNGTSVQVSMGSRTWRLVSDGDGGDVAVDNVTMAPQSIRYSSSQKLGNFRREIYDPNNTRVGNPTFPALTVDSGAQLEKPFVTPVELNAIRPARLIIGGSNAFYESFNQGNSITQINGPGATVNNATSNAIAYGGRSGGTDNEDILYVGSGPGVFLRTTAGAALTATAALPTGATTVRDITLDPEEWRNAYVVDQDQVFRTTNAGVSWTDITGNLRSLGGDFNTTVLVRGAANGNDLLLVGTNAGVFVSFSGSGFTSWTKLGSGLPNVRVLDLDYDIADDMLVVATLGRGAWTLTNLRNITPPTTFP